MLASIFGAMIPMAHAADLVSVQPTVAKLTKTVEKTAFDPSTILPPAVAVNFDYAQAKGKATSLLSWAVKTEKGTPQYTVVFATQDKKTITVVFDAVSGKLLSVTK